MLSPFPPEMGGCLTKESTPDDGIGLESDHSGEEPNSECYSSTVSEDSSSTQEASGVEEQANGDTREFSSAESLGSDSTIVDFSGEIIQAEEQEACNKLDNPELPRDGNNEEMEDSVEEGGIGSALSKPKRDESLENILPALPEDLDVPAPLGNGEEADEEDSEDSDESDEELRSYNIQEQSDESDEEFPVVPVVVSDRSSARHLRSLLKMPSILTQSFCDELESKKKAVSFFDDVTVFLFDQVCRIILCSIELVHWVACYFHFRKITLICAVLIWLTACVLLCIDSGEPHRWAWGLQFCGGRSQWPGFRGGAATTPG